jgi:hypothetical protein
MSVNHEDITQFMQMNREDEDAHLAKLFSEQSGESPATQASEQEQGKPVAEAGKADTAAQPQPTPEIPANPADPEVVNGADTRVVPYGSMHAERMKRQEESVRAANAEARANQLQAQLDAAKAQQSPQQPDQPAAEVPGLAIESPEAIQHIVNEALKPHLQTISTLQGMLGSAQEHSHLAELAQRHNDPHLPALIAQFDAEVPHFKAQGIEPRARYFRAKGIQAIDPATQQQTQQQTQAQIAAQARDLAIQNEEKRLAGQNQQPPTPSLSGLPPAVPNGSTHDPSAMNFKQFAALSPEAEERMLKGDFQR